MDPNATSDADNSNRDAAEKVVRDQLDAIYDNRPAVTTPAASTDKPAASTHAHAYQSQAKHFQRYHTEWQNYYQKYYEQYYVGHMHQVLAAKEQEAKAKEEAAKTPQEKRDEAVFDLRQRIVTNTKTTAKKARKSRHFIPIMSALVVMFVVGFLQYNEIIFGTVQAFVSPGTIDPQNIITDPTASVAVGPDAKLIIPKINVDVPIIDNVAIDYNAQMAAMQKGVAHFAIPGANSEPGQNGNTVYSGHSSNDLFDPGDYKFIFAQLDKLTTGDTFFVNYNSVRYTYTVTGKKVVKPDDVASLYGDNSKPRLTLITCTPLGTSTNRLLVFADQVSPDPSKATATNAQATSSDGAAMPGNAPTALERLFGAKG
jgi:sortase A